MDVYIDFKSPTAYLALKPTLAMAEELGVTPRWLPIRTRQRAVAAPSEHETKSETHFRVRETQRHNMHLHYAALQQTPMRFRDDPGETDLSLAALLFAGPDHVAFIENAFSAYWATDDDLNDPATVMRLLTDSGLDPAQFDPETYLARLESHLEQAAQDRVIDAPAYLLAGQIFIGREHLPWIREILTDQSSA